MCDLEVCKWKKFGFG